MPQPRRDDYLVELAEATEGIDPGVESMVEAIASLKRSGNRLWILGNGGSLALAQHFAQDLLKAHGIRAQCLNDPSVITAYANDHSFDYCFFAPLRELADKGDGVLIFSVSGKSRNYVEFASQGFHPLLAVVGSDGGFLLEKSDHAVHIRSGDYALCETAFSMVADLISAGLEERCRRL